MTVPVGAIIRCAVRQQISGRDVVNVYEFEHQGSNPVDEADVLTAAASYFDSAYATLNSVVSNAMTPVDIKIDVVDVISGVKKVIANVGLVLWGSSYSPAAAGERTASGNAILVKFLTTVGKIIGKKFLGIFTEANCGGDGFDGTLAAALVNFGAYLLGVLSVSGEPFYSGVLSVSQDHPGVFFPFTDADVANTISYQRRRKPGVGS